MTHPSILASHPALATLEDTWPDEAGCAALAERLALTLAPTLRQGGSHVIELHGTLGAGKTTFTRHLLRALGVQGRIKSPSYAVVEPHQVPGIDIQHFDFYRFNDPQEWEDAGFRDLFGANGLKLVEWPDKAAGLLPCPDLQLLIEPLDEHRRQVRLQACTAAGIASLNAMAQAGEAAHG
ncbi:tRNA (adenosine(37)-N6)-threonylcarbamoyltransferase complex ATPase subunit type 1 TsaE [Aquabacterium sp. UBA2148]|uniref:tRNA (adenosine(37)-N6)-threonylcarbamoyltransferase complex ATPase subunit type 1 TsaE n=1 Tax=Aquabacterium sp. UBA2148 TaxID=1946042 RepID=UPI00257CDADA|nr:tRNA (adenosine(37)-N6)-threonylcarbamoyltransferase complex ATPase subunit type 1 TsaE [Aquabacterium sp. UBA2148]